MVFLNCFCPCFQITRKDIHCLDKCGARIETIITRLFTRWGLFVAHHPMMVLAGDDRPSWVLHIAKVGSILLPN